MRRVIQTLVAIAAVLLWTTQAFAGTWTVYSGGVRYQIDGDNLYLLGCEGDPNADFPDYYNATGLLGHFSDGSNMTCLEYVGPGVPYGTLLNLRPAVPANPTNVTWQDRRWHSPAA